MKDFHAHKEEILEKVNSHKSLLIKLLVAFLVLLTIYTIFWFIKINQTKSEIEVFLQKYEKNVKFSQITTSGYPFSQKVNIKDFVLFQSDLRYETQIELLKIRSEVFSDNFTVDISNKVKLTDKKTSLNVIFKEKPKIQFGIDGDFLSYFLYEDSGYEALDNKKNSIYSAKSSRISLNSKKSASGAIKNKISININDLDGLDIIDFYQTPDEQSITGKNSDIILSLDINFDLEPSKEEESSVKYLKNIQINIFDFLSSFYDVSISGKMNTFADDNMPSGLFLAKVRNGNNFVKHIESEARKIDDVKYRNVATLLKQVASKNTDSVREDFVFRVQREKNLELVINEVPISYILKNLNPQEAVTDVKEVLESGEDLSSKAIAPTSPKNDIPAN